MSDENNNRKIEGLETQRELENILNNPYTQEADLRHLEILTRLDKIITLLGKLTDQQETVTKVLKG